MSEPRPTRRRRWGRRLLVLLVVAVLVLFLSPLLLGLPFVRNRVAAGIGDAIGRPVSLASASAFWGAGITLNGLTVASPAGFEEPLATVRRIHAKVDLPALLGGRVDAALEIDSPWVTFQEDEEGRSNADGLFPEGGAEGEPATPPAAPETSAGPDRDLQVVVRVRDGLLRARAPRLPPQEVRDLEATLSLSSAEGLAARLEAVAVGAGEGGVDAPIEVDVHQPAAAGAEGPLRARIAPLDLSRLAGVVRGLTGIEDLTGRLAADVDARFTAAGDARGQGRVTLDRLAMDVPDVGRIALQRLVLEGDLDGEAGGVLRADGTDLFLGPGPLSHRGYREPTLQMAATATRGDDGALALTLDRLQSRLLALGTRPGASPIRLEPGTDAPTAKGSAFVRLDLPVLAEGFGAALGLEPDDTMRGSVEVDVTLDAAGEEALADLVLSGQGVVLPASWGGADLPPTDLDGRARVETRAGVTTLEIRELRGFGLASSLEARLAETGLEGARLSIDGDLARARPLLAVALGFEGREALAGTLAVTANVTPVEGGSRLEAETALRGLQWSDAEGRVILQEPEVRLVQRLFVGEADAAGTTPYRIDAFRLDAAGLVFALTGSATRREGSDGDGDIILDAKATLEGDAARLAPAVARFLGPDYDDLVGRGRLEGSLALRGGLRDRGASLLVDGDVRPGSWSSGGLTLDGPHLVLRRATVADPIALRVESGVNQGTLELDVGVRPSAEALPWTLDLAMQQVDTSPLLLDRGTGQYLTLLFPTLLPTDATTRVLSGRLDATLALAAQDAEGDRMAATLEGEGRVEMADGAIGQSTLFRVAGSGGGLGQAGRVLGQAVPEVGRGLAELSRALTFTKVESAFRIGRQIVNIDRGLLDGNTVRIGFRGRVAFDERVDLEVPVMIKGRAAERLNALLGSPALPLKVTGTVSDPRIAPGIDAKKLAQGALGGLLPGGQDGQKPLDRLKDLLK